MGKGRRKKRVPVFNFEYNYMLADKWADGVVRKMRELPRLTGRPMTKIAKMLGISSRTYDRIINYETIPRMPWTCIYMIERYHKWAKCHQQYFAERKKPKKKKEVVYFNVDYDNTQQNGK